MAFRKFTRKKEDGTEDKRKIKSSKVEQDGIVFDSKLENYFYNLLKENNIEFELKPEYQLLETFKYRHETIQGMRCTPDYYLPKQDIIVDCKGFSNELSPVRYKLLKHILTTQGKNPRIVMPSTQKKCLKLIQEIKDNSFTVDEPLTENAGTKRKNKLKRNGWEWLNGNWEKRDGLGFLSVTHNASYIMSLPIYEFEELLIKYK